MGFQTPITESNRIRPTEPCSDLTSLVLSLMRCEPGGAVAAKLIAVISLFAVVGMLAQERIMMMRASSRRVSCRPVVES